MAIATYSDLQTSVANWLKRSDLTSIIPDFITLAEARIARDLRLRRQVTNTALSTVAGTQTVTLPSDFLEMENITLTNTTPPAALSVVTPEIMDRKFPSGYVTGQPVVYTIVGDQVQLGPTPDAVYTVRPLGQVLIAAPSSDSEPDNPWMTKGYELIRCAAKAYIYLHTHGFVDQAATFAVAAERELNRLRRDTSKRTATGDILACA
jgi:hypothetical protein